MKLQQMVLVIVAACAVSVSSTLADELDFEGFPVGPLFGVVNEDNFWINFTNGDFEIYANTGVGGSQSPNIEPFVTAPNDGFFVIAPVAAGNLDLISFALNYNGNETNLGVRPANFGVPTGEFFAYTNTGGNYVTQFPNFTIPYNQVIFDMVNEPVHFEFGLRGATHIDNINIIPEPMSLLLMGSGAMALVRRYRRA